METPNLDIYLSNRITHGEGTGHFIANDAVRGEYAALKQRVEDLELMLRAVGNGTHVERFDAGYWRLIVAPIDRPEDGMIFRMDDDGTGLPLLTAEAREALRGAR